MEFLHQNFLLAQQQALQCAFCGGNHVNGACDTLGGGYCYQPQFDYAPRSDFYPQASNYLPTMVENPDFSYDSSYPLQPDSSHFMPNPLHNGAQDFYQPYSTEIPSSQEGWHQSQEISPSLESALMAFMQQTEVYMQDAQATFKSHETSLRNLEEQIGQIVMQISEGPNGISPNNVMMSPMEPYNSLTTSGMTSPTIKESAENEIFDLESVIEDYSEEEMDELTPKVNDEEFTTLEGQKLLQAMKGFKIVESQVLEPKAILPSCDVFLILNEDGLNNLLQPQGLNPIMKEVGYQEEVKGSLESSNISIVLKDSSMSFIFIIPRYLCFKQWDPGGSHYDVCDKFLAFNFKPP